MQYTFKIMHQTSWSKHTISIFIFSTFTTIIFIYLLMNESLLASFIPCTPACSKVIGEVAFVKGDVRRRLPGDILWLPIEQDASIIDGDTLFTGSDGSGVKVRLGKDTTLDINSDSMVNVSFENKQAIVNLDTGSLISYGGPGDLLKVRINRKIYSMSLSSQPQEISRDAMRKYTSRNNLSRNQKLFQDGKYGTRLNSSAPETSTVQTPIVVPSSEQIIEWKNKEYKSGINDQTKKIFISIIITLYSFVSLAVFRELYKNNVKK